MKPTRILSAAGAALISTASLLALAPAAHATPVPDLYYAVTLNLSSLVGNPDGNYSLDLQLAPGSDNVTNTVKLYNFSYVGGSPSGTPDYTQGGESGSILPNGIVTLTNSNPSDNEFAAALAAGVTQISFNVDQTPNSEVVGSGTPIPDQFNVAILDNTLTNINTTDPSTGNELLSSDFGSPETENLSTVKTYSSLSPDGGVTVAIAAPEPSSWALSILATCAMIGMVMVRRHHVA